MAVIKEKENLQRNNRYIEKNVISEIGINAKPEKIWTEITNVQIEKFSDPQIFRILGIPRPLKADLLIGGEGGKRIAYFDNGKRFIQEITTWKPNTEYAFNFNPEEGFVVAYFFDLSDGVFKVPKGSYHLSVTNDTTVLKLSTSYSLDRSVYYLFNIPVRIILKAFQNYLLTSIKKNCE